MQKISKNWVSGHLMTRNAEHQKIREDQQIRNQKIRKSENTQISKLNQQISKSAKIRKITNPFLNDPKWKKRGQQISKSENQKISSENQKIKNQTISKSANQQISKSADSCSIYDQFIVVHRRSSKCRACFNLSLFYFISLSC